MSPKTLNAYVPWTELAPILKIELANEALPSVAECPLCHKMTLHVYEDMHAGHWHHCMNPRCGSHGDMVELAAKVWRISAADAVHELHKRGMPLPADNAAIEKYIDKHHGRQQRIADLWQRAQAYYLRGSNLINMLKNHFGLNCSIPLERWKEGPGRLLGSAHCGDIEETFMPASMASNADPNDRYNRSGCRIFSGKKWTEVLVLPYWVTPNRISAFRFVGRQGRPEDHAVRACSHGNGMAVKEGGLFGLPAACEAFVTGATVIAVDDCLLAARLHCRHARNSLKPLPVVAWQSDKKYCTKKAWQSINCSRVVIWVQELTAEAIDQAMMINACISLAGPEEKTKQALDHYIRLPTTTEALLARVEKQARPWEEMLTTWVRDNYDPAVRAMFNRLHRLGRPPHTVVYNLPEDVRGRILTLASSEYSAEHRSVMLGSMQIIERQSGWYYRRKVGKVEEQISNAILRVNRIELLTNKTVYSGNILYRGEAIPFFTTDIEHCTARWMSETVLRSGKGLYEVRAGWKMSLYNLAIKFHKPEIVDRRQLTD